MALAAEQSTAVIISSIAAEIIGDPRLLGGTQIFAAEDKLSRKHIIRMSWLSATSLKEFHVDREISHIEFMCYRPGESLKRFISSLLTGMADELDAALRDGTLVNLALEGFD